MPLIGSCAHAMLAKMRHELSGARKAGSSLTYTDPHLLEELNHAYAELQRTLSLHTSEGTRNLTSGTSDYDLPLTVSGFTVHEVKIRNQTGSGSITLTRRTKEFMRGIYDLDDSSGSAQGTPADWGPHQSNSRQITIRPIPNYAVTNGVLFYFTVRHTPLTRIWRPGKLSTPITAGMIFNDATVTFLAAIDLEMVRVGDHLGVIPVLSADQSTLVDENPSSWYEIDTITSPALELTETYDGETDSSVNVIVSQVSALEVAFPDKIGWSPAYMAVAEILERSDPEAAGRMRARAGQVLAVAGQPDEEFTRPTPARPGVSTNMLRSD